MLKRRILMKSHVFFLILIFAAIPLIIHAGTPQLINFQGKAHNSNGGPLNGTFSIEFTIYDAVSEGSSVWNETQSAVQITDGIFHVLLGSINPIADSVFSDSARYLGVKIGSDPEMTPLTQIATVPYAFRTASVDGAEGGYLKGRASIGLENVITGDNSMSVGWENEVSSNSSFVAGNHNVSNGDFALVSGYNNSTNGSTSAIIGGASNIAEETYSVVIGGFDNKAEGGSSVVVGGSTNTAAGNGSIASGFRARANHSGTFVWQSRSNSYFESTNSNQFLIRATGGFGINTNEPKTSFHVLGQEESEFMPSSALQSETVVFEDQDAILGLYSKPQGSVGSALTFGEISGGTLDNKWTIIRETASGGSGLRIAFGTNSNPFNNSTYMYLDNNGEIGIGTRNPSEKLHVSGSICATGSIGSCSDERFKENIHDIDNALDQVERIKGVEFSWKKEDYPDYDFSDEEQIGFIAQDLKEVLPEVVSVGSDGYHSIDYGKLTPVLVEAVKQLKTENDELRARLDRIEAMLEDE
jgi:hypothetical protein